MISLLVRRQERLTGNLRGRRQWLTGKIVLQVEVVQMISTNIAPCPPPPWCLDVEAWERQQLEKERLSWRKSGTFWRDATQDELAPQLSITRAEINPINTGGYQPVWAEGPIKPPPRKP